MSPRDALLRALLLLVMLSSPAAVAEVDTWTKAEDIPTSRVLHASCSVGGKIYVFGGQREGGGGGIDSVEEYDPSTDSWRKRSSMPMALLGMTASAVGGKCYLIGSTDAPGGQALNRVDEYDPASNSWRRRAPMPTGRVMPAAAVVNGKIYVAGGWAFGDIRGAAFSSLEIYDPASNIWSSGADMPTPRAMLAAGADGEKIHFIGGGSAALGALDTSIVETYDPGSDKWTQGAEMPTARGALTTAVVDGLIYAIGGGFEFEQVAAVEVYDPVTDSWSTRAPMPTARWGVSGGLVSGQIYVLGGSTERGIGHNSLATNEAYSARGFEINPGLNDAWYNRDTDGQGIFVIVYPNIRLIFAAWFTYEADSNSGESQDLLATFGDDDHRWLTASGFYEEGSDRALLNISITHGGKFDAGDPVERFEDGTIELFLEHCNKMVARYSIPSIDRTGEVTLERVAKDNIEFCEELNQ